MVWFERRGRGGRELEMEREEGEAGDERRGEKGRERERE